MLHTVGLCKGLPLWGRNCLTLATMSVHNSVGFYTPSHIYMRMDNLTNRARIFGPRQHRLRACWGFDA